MQFTLIFRYFRCRIFNKMSQYGVYTDEELLEFLRDGDRTAFTEIYNRYWQVLITHACKILKDDDEALDVVQDIFLTIWNRSSDLEIKSSLKSYLYTATRNQALKVINRSNLKEEFAGELAAAFEEGLSTTDEAVAFNELSAILEEAIKKLPPRLKIVYEKSREQGLSHRAIAEELNIAENTVKSAMHRTLTYLRSKLTLFLSIIFFLMR